MGGDGRNRRALLSCAFLSCGICDGWYRSKNLMVVFFPSIGHGAICRNLGGSGKDLSSKSRRWTKENSITALFNFAVFGIMGLTQHYRYECQNEVFGSGHSFQELASKVAFDQFIWTVIFANPYQAVCYLWKNNSFSWRAVHRHMFPFRSFGVLKCSSADYQLGVLDSDGIHHLLFSS